jgi:radical SAM superfamily enzyme YgiQ (UPF0313 family)
VKVVLAKPCWDYPKGPSESTYNRVWPPLELANCAAILRAAGHDASIIDAQSLGLPPEALARRAAGADLVLLTSTGLDRWQCPYNDAAPFVAAAKAIKAAGPRLAAAGFYPTVAPDATLNLTGADFVIRGEPEGVVIDIASGKNPSDIAGVSYLRSGRIVSNPDRSPVDLASLPVPAFELFDLDRYFYEILGNRFLLFEATRGCPYSCVFCSRVMYGQAFRKKSAAQMHAEIDHALAHTNVRSAYFIDLEFTVARDLAISVCEHLIAKGSPLAWCCQTRADNVDEELLALMKKAGCRLIHLGVESGSDRVLSASGKATSKDAIGKGVRMIEKAGIETLAFFMFGLPGETDDEREETIRFAKDLAPTYASFHFATPYPGSKLFSDLNMKIGDNLSFPLVPPGADVCELKSWVSRAVRSFYLRPSYVLRHLAKGGPSHWYRQFRLFLSYLR